jgi:NADPH:quinone reductase-like Zn-dependent oxidoreductase
MASIVSQNEIRRKVEKDKLVSRNGGPEVLEIVEEAAPEPQAGEARVKMVAAGVAWGDILRRRGISAPLPPFIPGYDLVGVVERVGEGVTAVQEGQMVAALPVTGGYAETICLPEGELVAVPKGMNPAVAGSLVLNGITAYQILHRAGEARPGERLLVHGASGGVGTLMVQLARAHGLEVFGTASPGKHELVASLDATPIDYRREDFVEHLHSLAGGGMDIVADPIGGSSLRRSYRTLRRGGRLITYGVQAIFAQGRAKVIGSIILASLMNLVPDRKSVRLYNVTRPKYSTPEWCRQDLSEIFELWAQGKVKPIVADQIPLVEAAHAHELLENGSHVGKIVLIGSA